ncbi:hypothetical protein CB1_002519025 [Camelus ferus]|nr:hypothetical protein CB1_002519025 [Camelus ferus]
MNGTGLAVKMPWRIAPGGGVLHHTLPQCLHPNGSLASKAAEPQGVTFPSPIELPELEQLHYPDKLLQHMAPSLELEFSGHGLWAWHWGKCKVYWEASGPLTLSSASPCTLAT